MHDETRSIRRVKTQYQSLIVAYLRLMLFCRANWIPLKISGISGTIANTVTPMKYCRNE
jgi:hypothetical protein